MPWSITKICHETEAKIAMTHEINLPWFIIKNNCHVLKLPWSWKYICHGELLKIVMIHAMVHKKIAMIHKLKLPWWITKICHDPWTKIAMVHNKFFCNGQFFFHGELLKNSMIHELNLPWFIFKKMPWWITKVCHGLFAFIVPYELKKHRYSMIQKSKRCHGKNAINLTWSKN